LTKNWVAHDVRDQVVDFVRCWSEKSGISVGRFPQWLGIGASKFYDWRQRCGRVNEHNGWIPGISGWSRGRRKPLSPYARPTFLYA
jgi:hypothetical protein